MKTGHVLLGIVIPVDLARRVRTEALRRGMTNSDLAAEALDRAMPKEITIRVAKTSKGKRRSATTRRPHTAARAAWGAFTCAARRGG